MTRETKQRPVEQKPPGATSETCNVLDCDKPADGCCLGFCKKHHGMLVERGGFLTFDPPIPIKPPPKLDTRKWVKCTRSAT